MGFVGAVVGSTIGVAAWIAIASWTMRPATYMAVVLGALTGLGARALGRADSASGASWSAIIALLGCAAGTMYAQAAVVAALRSTTTAQYVAHLPLFVAVYSFESYFKSSDILWYAIGVVAAWLLASRRTALPSAEKRAPGAAT
jgi:hypothetical protein